MIYELGNQFLHSLYGVEGLILGLFLQKLCPQAQYTTQLSFLGSHLSGTVTPTSHWANLSAAELSGAISSLRLALRDQGGDEPAPIPVPGVCIAPWAQSLSLHPSVPGGQWDKSEQPPCFQAGAGADGRPVPALLPGVREAAHPAAAGQVDGGGAGAGAGNWEGPSQHLPSLSEQVPGGNDFLDAGIRPTQGPWDSDPPPRRRGREAHAWAGRAGGWGVCADAPLLPALPPELLCGSLESRLS